MENWRVLYRITFEHDYFEGVECNIFRCSLTKQGLSLSQRRSLCFRQTAENEWTLYYYNLPREDDVISLSLSITDSSFPLYTDLDGYTPMASYELDLPSKTDKSEAATDITITEGRRNLGMGFCTIRIHLNREVGMAAEEGNPMRTTIHFAAKSAIWTYLFIPRRGSMFDTDQMHLVDANDTVDFVALTQDAEYEGAARTSSKTLIPMRNSYKCKLRLVAYDKNKRKVTLLSNVQPPVPGEYMDVPKGTIHKIYYY